MGRLIFLFQNSFKIISFNPKTATLKGIYHSLTCLKVIRIPHLSGIILNLFLMIHWWCYGLLNEASLSVNMHDIAVIFIYSKSKIRSSFADMTWLPVNCWLVKQHFRLLFRVIFIIKMYNYITLKSWNTSDCIQRLENL